MADTALNPSQSVKRILGRPLEFCHGLRGGSAGARDPASRPRAPAAPWPNVRRGFVGRPASSASTSPGRLPPSRRFCCATRSPRRLTVVGAAILDLLAELREELSIAYMFITPRLVDGARDLRRGHDPLRRSNDGIRQPNGVEPATAASLFGSAHFFSAGAAHRLARQHQRHHLKEASAGTPRAHAIWPAASALRLRIPGRCDSEATPIRRLSKGADIRCQRTGRGAPRRGFDLAPARWGNHEPYLRSASSGAFLQHAWRAEIRAVDHRE